MAYRLDWWLAWTAKRTPLAVRNSEA